MSETQTIPRYSQWCAITHRHTLGEHPNGPYVRFSDFDRIVAEKDAVIARLQARLQTRPFQDHGEQ